MKFRRINYLDKPIVLFRTHFFTITLRYEYDFGGPDMTGANPPELSFYKEYGDFTVTVIDVPGSPNYYDVTVSGRFYKPYSGTFQMTTSLLPVTLPTGFDYVEDFVAFEVRNEYFWSGNPIRIPLKEQPTDPLKLFAETAYQSGDFKEIASINIQDIVDERGHYVEVNDYLNAWIGRDGWKDFTSIYGASDEQNEYRYSIRRFHLLFAGLEVGDTESDPLPSLNYFTVVHGRQNPSAFFESGEAWNIDDVMSWRPADFTYRIGNMADTRLPFSAFDTHNRRIASVETTQDGSPTTFDFLPNWNQTITQVLHTQLYIFLLIQEGSDTRIYFTERKSIHFRGIHHFKNMQGQFILATDQIPDTPSMWLFFRDVTGDLVAWNFDAGIYDAFNLISNTEYRVKARITGESLEWRGVCMDFNNTRPSALIGATGVDETYFVHMTGTTTQVPETAMSTYIADTMCCGNDNDSFVVVNQNLDIFKTVDNGDNWAAVAYTSGYLPKRIFRIDNDNYVLIWLKPEENILYGTLADIFGTEVLNHDSIEITEYQDCILDGQIVRAFVGGTTKLFINFDFSGYPAWTGSTSFVDFDEKVSNRFLLKSEANINVLDINTNNWLAVNSQGTEPDVLLLPPAFYAKMVVSEADVDPFEFTFDYPDSSRILRYRYDGAYYRNQRTLYFKNQCGAYEILMMLGQGRTELSAKKQMSSRYVDSTNEFDAGEDFTAFVTDAITKLTVNSGWLTKAQFEYFLNELTLSKEGFLTEPEKDPIPVNFVIGKAQPINDDPDQYFIEITITKAWNRI